MTPAPRTPGTSPAGKPTCWPCGTVRGSVRPTIGSTVEFANLRAAFRWAADHRRPRHRRGYRLLRSVPRFLGRAVRARRVGRGTHRAGEAVDHRGWPSSTSMAAQCYAAGRRRRLRSDTARPASRPSQADVSTRCRIEFEALLGGTYCRYGRARAVGRVVPQHDRARSRGRHVRAGLLSCSHLPMRRAA